MPFASLKSKVKWEISFTQHRQTLKSIQNSTIGNYRVVVAGHEAPDFDVGFNSRFYFLPLKHPFPSHDNYGVAVKSDKLTKIAAAWNYSKLTWNPNYVMKLDADDFISSRLVD